MTCHPVALSIDANDPLRLARFWAGVLGWDMVDDPPDGIALPPSDDTGFRIEFFLTQEQKAGQNQMHVDLTSTPVGDVLGELGAETERGIGLREPNLARTFLTSACSIRGRIAPLGTAPAM